jgi:hypothetical protein
MRVEDPVNRRGGLKLGSAFLSRCFRGRRFCLPDRSMDDPISLKKTFYEFVKLDKFVKSET